MGQWEGLPVGQWEGLPVHSGRGFLCIVGGASCGTVGGASCAGGSWNAARRRGFVYPRRGQIVPNWWVAKAFLMKGWLDRRKLAPLQL